MQSKVLDNRYGYEDDNIIIVHGKNKDDGSIFYMCLDKKSKDIMPLGACIWCGANLL